MKAFAGFPQEVHFGGIPKLFFSQLLPEIDDISELKVTIYLLHVLYERKGYPRFITDRELVADKALMRGIGDQDALLGGLDRALRRGTIISLAVESDESPTVLYFLNTESDREARAKIESGEIDIGMLPGGEPFNGTEARPNIFTLYEENIGMLSPMIAEELKDAEKRYPESWIEDAFKEAVSLNKRNWRYIEAILKRWDNEGKGHGELGRGSKADRDRYIKEKYGPLVKRRID
jgi:DnaD/phage-associated family protein